MLIENPEAFKSWLTSVLEPLCDADPAALAKYVYALVKKDKPIEDLRDGMVDQLDVFLQNETKPFVELLFKSLESLEYLKSISAIQPATDVKASISPVSTDKPPRAKLENHEHNNVAKPTSLDILSKDELNDIPRNDRSITKEKDQDSRPRHNNDNMKRDISAKQRIVLNRATKFVPAVVPKEKPAYATEQTLVKVIPDLLEDSLNEQLPTRNNKPTRKSDSDKEDRRRRQRSRSRSWDRTRRPAGATRPMWRNRSPPLQQNRYERRRSRSGSPPVRVPRYRNRSPPPGSELDTALNRSRSRSRERLVSPGPNGIRDRSSRERERDRQSRTRDRIDRTDRDRDRLDRDREDRPGRGRDSGTATPTQDSNPGDSGSQPRGTTTLAGIFGSTQKKRCWDFDEKGYCMRGDQCQFDHGVDPLVLEEPTSISHLYLKNQPAIPMPMTRPPPRLPAPGCVEYNPLAPDIWNRGGPRNMYTAPPPPYFPYMNAPPRGHHQVQRELIPVPIAMVENMPPGNNGVNHSNAMSIRPPLIIGAPLAPVVPTNNHSIPPPNHPMKKKPFDFNRLGPNRHIPKIPGGNCSLELKKVPRGLNDIMHLNNHFSKFGKIINIQVNYEEDPEAALITFSSHTEANVAYKSTEAVLNNRFIKVFWHNSEQSKQENVPPIMKISAKDRLNPGLNNHVNNNNNHVSYNKVLINKDSMKVVNNAQSEVKQPTNLQKSEANNVVAENDKNGDDSNAMLANEPTPAPPVDATIRPDVPASIELAEMKRRYEEGAVKIAKDLRQQLRRLLDKQLQEQKMLIQRLDSKTITEAQKESLHTTIKGLQVNIEKTKKDLVSNPKTLSLQNKKAAFGALKKVPRSKEEAQKELLDAELDMYTKQQEGEDVTDLQKRVTELKRQQHALKPIPTRRPSAHRVSPRGRFTKAAGGAKSGMFVNQSVDHRPRSFLVSGYEADELDQLMQHFTQFGEIVENIPDPTTPSLWLQFKTRKIAEQAATKGRQFNDRTLTVTWQPKIANSIAPQSPIEKIMISDDAELNDPCYRPQSPNSKMSSEAVCPPSPSYSKIDISSYNFPDSEDDEGKDYDKEEERSWRR